MDQPFKDDVVAAAEAVGAAALQLADAMYPSSARAVEVRTRVRYRSPEATTIMQVEVWDTNLEERMNMIEVKV